MKGTKGFTLVELVIVIIIVGILSIVAVPIYRGYTKRAYTSEGRALLGSIQTAQKVYYAEWGHYAQESGATNGKGTLLDVDSSQNKYFVKWNVTTASATGWTATTQGQDAANALSLTLVATNTGTPTLTETGTQNQ